MLNELGVPGGAAAAAAAPTPAQPGPASAPAAMRPAGGPGAPNAPAPAPVRPASSRVNDDGSVVAVYDPTSEGEGPRGNLLEMLLEENVIDRKQATAAELITKQSSGISPVPILLDQGVDEIRLLQVVARWQNLPFERIDLAAGPDVAMDGALYQRIGAEQCKSAEVIPLRMEGDRAVIGTSRPDDVFALDEVRQRLRVRSVKIVVVPGSEIRALIEMVEGGAEEQVDVDSLLSDIEEDDVRVDATEQDQVDLQREAAESPVIRYVNYIIQTAVKEGASDIHIEPAEKSLKVRFRIDGVLFEMMQPPGRMAAAITSRLKIMANLDISERRLPQDGRIRCVVNNRKLDLRMSTLPTAYGEKTVLRILDQKSINVDLSNLGFDENTLELWKNQIDQPHGIVLVTGPTGSGKTTTLYASLRQMDKKTQNVSTVEDPVEYHLDGITQTQMHEKIGMTFAIALRALLRQDPDVVMLGEIRDAETAHVAVQAALTGHLVLSTLHTNDAPSSITRLVNIGLEPFLIGAAVNATLAQRLVRRICQSCRKEATLSDDQREFLELRGLNASQVYQGAGCPKCRSTGYSGRVGIYELLVIDDHLRDVIARNPNVTEFRRTCIERGMVSLRDDGLAKVARGQTTIEEILRVTESTI
jgi:type IV pilus assembly protein PilB